MADDIVLRLRAYDADGWEAADEIERLRAVRDASRLIISDLAAERDASRLIISDLTAERERLRAAGDRLAAAVNAVACSGPRDEMAELTDAFLDWEARRG